MTKVAASSLRKGSVLDVDGKLYVVLRAENIHPGKGTPVTQLDMRRIADGVKVSERYRTTEQVEKAFVDQRDHTFLYKDGDGFHFMNPETYEQYTATEEVIGDAAAYLQDGMTVNLSIHDDRAHALIGERSGQRFRLGAQVQVRLREATPLTGGLLLEMLSEPEPPDPTAPRPRLGMRGRGPQRGGAPKGLPRGKRRGR